MLDLIQSCRPVRRVTVRSLGVTLIYTLAVIPTVGQLHVAAQQASPTRSLIPVTVTDRYRRVVTGLDKESFVILENGSPRPVTYLSNVDSPIAIAIVSKSPFPSDDILKPEDDLIQTSSLSDAVRQLIASRKQRKAIVVTAASDLRGIPAGIQVVQADPANIFKAIVELRDQYVLGFRPSDPAGLVEVTINQPRDLPILEAVWKEPF
jgi:hypothetical protein